MQEYFLRRFLLIPPTLLGVTIIVFAITRMVPGGPLEQAMMEMQKVGERGGGSDVGSSQAMSEEQIEQLKEHYGFDRPTVEAYFLWLGAAPSEAFRKNIKFENVEEASGVETQKVRVRTPEFHVMDLDWDQDGWLTRQEVPKVLSRAVKFDDLDADKDGFVTADECVGDAGVVNRASEIVMVEYHRSQNEAWVINEESLMFDWKVRMKEPLEEEPDTPRAVVYIGLFKGVLQGQLGDSFRYGEPVTQVMLQRLPISTYFGVMLFLITYSVSIPLGVVKAVKHNGWVDNLTSILIFMGYAVPSYVLGSLLVVFAAVKWRWFPAGGFTSEGFEEFTFLAKCWDVLYHSVLPLICYIVGTFAFVSMLMKNHLMDNLAADYMRTAVAKGVTFKESVTKHALRNSLIPIATNVGHQISLFVVGSFLIETIFDIDGFGLLGFQSVLDRDYPVVMGVILLSATLMLLGNILADILVAIVDPRVRFH